MVLGAKNVPTSNLDEALVLLVARAVLLRHQLETNDITSIGEYAEAQGMHHSDANILSSSTKHHARPPSGPGDRPERRGVRYGGKWSNSASLVILDQSHIPLTDGNYGLISRETGAVCSPAERLVVGAVISERVSTLFPSFTGNLQGKFGWFGWWSVFTAFFMLHMSEFMGFYPISLLITIREFMRKRQGMNERMQGRVRFRTDKLERGKR